MISRKLIVGIIITGLLSLGVITGCQSDKISKNIQTTTTLIAKEANSNQATGTEKQPSQPITNASRAQDIEKSLIEDAKYTITKHEDFQGLQIKDIQIITSDQIRSFTNDGFPKRDSLIGLQTYIDDKRSGKYVNNMFPKEFAKISEGYIFLVTLSKPIEGATKKDVSKFLLVLIREYNYQDFVVGYELFEDGFARRVIQ